MSSSVSFSIPGNGPLRAGQITVSSSSYAEVGASFIKISTKLRREAHIERTAQGCLKAPFSGTESGTIGRLRNSLISGITPRPRRLMNDQKSCISNLVTSNRLILRIAALVYLIVSAVLLGAVILGGKSGVSLAFPAVFFLLALAALAGSRFVKLNLDNQRDLTKAKEISKKLPFVDLVGKFSLEEIRAYELLTKEELQASFRKEVPNFNKQSWSDLEMYGVRARISLADIIVYELASKEELHDLFLRALQNRGLVGRTHIRQQMWPLYQFWGVISEVELTRFAKIRNTYHQRMNEVIETTCIPSLPSAEQVGEKEALRRLDFLRSLQNPNSLSLTNDSSDWNLQQASGYMSPEDCEIFTQISDAYYQAMHEAIGIRYEPV